MCMRDWGSCSACNVYLLAILAVSGFISFALDCGSNPLLVPWCRFITDCICWQVVFYLQHQCGRTVLRVPEIQADAGCHICLFVIDHFLTFSSTNSEGNCIVRQLWHWHRRIALLSVFEAVINQATVHFIALAVKFDRHSFLCLGIWHLDFPLWRSSIGVLNHRLILFCLMWT
jgi:hypothetical protein